jgi:hypothetical protein
MGGAALGVSGSPLFLNLLAPFLPPWAGSWDLLPFQSK